MEKPKSFEVIKQSGLRCDRAYDADEIDAWLDSISVESLGEVLAGVYERQEKYLTDYLMLKDMATAIHKLIRGGKYGRNKR